MNDDDELCLCFHVTRRKVMNFIRIERPRLPSQMSECFGAGTGCGWCRSFLAHLVEQSQRDPQSAVDLPSATEYARGRSAYVRDGGGKPPAGATPILPAE